MRPKSIRKPLVFYFQRVWKETSGMRWVTKITEDITINSDLLSQATSETETGHVCSKNNIKINKINRMCRSVRCFS